MKAAVECRKEDFASSEGRACDVLHLPVSACRYRSVRCDAALREKLVELAREKPRFGYRRLHVLLRRDGEQVNHKRVWRVYREAGLCVKRRKRKRLVRAGMKPAIAITANQEWALDFAADVLATGRTVRCPRSGRYLHSRVLGARGRHELRQPPCHACARTDHP